MQDVLDVLETFGHFCITGFAYVISHWEPACAFVLMGMQGVYLFYKIKQKRKECL